MGKYIIMGALAAGISAGWMFVTDKYYIKRFEEKLGMKRVSLAGGVVLNILLSLASCFYGYSIFEVLGYIFLAPAFIGIAAIDRRKQIIPNLFVLILLGFRIVTIGAGAFTSGENVLVYSISYIAGALFCASILLITRCVAKGGIGMGDIKAVAVAGLYFGLEKTMVVLIISMVIAMIAGLARVARKKLRLKDSLSFGPYLATGSILVMLLV